MDQGLLSPTNYVQQGIKSSQSLTIGILMPGIEINTRKPDYNNPTELRIQKIKSSTEITEIPQKKEAS